MMREMVTDEQFGEAVWLLKSLTNGCGQGFSHWVLLPLRGWIIFYFPTHGSRRGLYSFAAPRLMSGASSHLQQPRLTLIEEDGRSGSADAVQFRVLKN
jgi:hypothetical protein